ncbi:HAD hydrolase-like protein [Chitinolyticbacter albus]|uniref:HAD hydrolase-like protein n=1 Tax=Chitinolyticbacter albus TaxID=2961951 RepID=UPI00210BB46F|nr:HAD hydrolase-like protein [Chitinolyticbacter albus]
MPHRIALISDHASPLAVGGNSDIPDPQLTPEIERLTRIAEEEGAGLCCCRKPAPGMVLQAAELHDIDLARSWLVGDILDDVEAGHGAGCRSILLDVGHETEWVMTPLRKPDFLARDLPDAASHIAMQQLLSPLPLERAR